MSSRIECTATSGQFISEDHCPPGWGPGVTEPDAFDSRPVPLALVADTLNV